MLAWYRSQAGGRGYQTLINATLRQVLREVIREELHLH